MKTHKVKMRSLENDSRHVINTFDIEDEVVPADCSETWSFYTSFSSPHPRLYFFYQTWKENYENGCCEVSG